MRSAGATQPISLGDGAWGVEVSGKDNGYSMRSLAPLVDFFGPHVYPMQDDVVRQSLTAAFVCELAGGFGKPVVLEEFGVSSDFASDDHAADYYRQVLHTSLLAGARGWIAWNNCDYDDLRDEDPYRHHVFEMHFGLTDRDGRPKQQLRVLGEFASLVRELADDGWERVEGDVALVVPEHFERVLPFTHDAYRSDLRDRPLPGLRRRTRGRPAGRAASASATASPTRHAYTSRRAPSCSRPRGSTASASSRRSGATVYLSYFAGTTANQRGPWLAWLDEIFGIRHRLRYGLVDPIEGDEVVFEFVEDFGDVAAGSLLRLHVAGEVERALVPAGRACRGSGRRRRRARTPRAAQARSSARERRSSAHIRSSTWRRARRGQTPSRRGGSTRRWPRSPASTGRCSVDDPRVLVGRVRTRQLRAGVVRQLLGATA